MVHYRNSNTSDHATITGFMKKLYQEDPGGQSISDKKITATFTELAAHPDKGAILVFEKERALIGYAILIYFWSNEHGGNILNIDEIFVAEQFRGQGVATDFMHHLMQTKPNNAVVLQLEITSGNLRARNLYAKLGFQPHYNDRMLLTLPA